jgi:hypothetical protein
MPMADVLAVPAGVPRMISVPVAPIASVTNETPTVSWRARSTCDPDAGPAT